MKKILIFFLVICYSCAEHSGHGLNKNNSDSGYTLKLAREVSIPLPPDEWNYSFLSIVKRFGDTTYLFRKAVLTNEIFVYNWDKKKRIKKIQWKETGPHRILNFKQGAFYPLSLDEFVVATPFNIYKTKNDSVYFHKTLGSVKNFKDAYVIFGKTIFPPLRIGARIYMYSAAEGLRGTVKYYNSNRLMQFHLKDHSVSKLNFKFPRAYYKKCWGSGTSHYSITKGKDSLLYVIFPVKPVVYMYDPVKEVFIDSVRFQSDYVNKKIKPIDCKVTGEPYRFHGFNQPKYRAIVYDPYREVFYVFVILPVSKELYDKTNEPFTISPLSIVVLDKNLNKLAEKKLEGGIYYYNEYFVTPEGLWINKNSPHNENFDDDYLRFDLFVLHKERP